MASGAAIGRQHPRATRLAAQNRLDRLTKAVGDLKTRHPLRRPASDRGGVAERLKAADCKSALFGVRWFESSPLHQSLRVDEQAVGVGIQVGASNGGPRGRV